MASGSVYAVKLHMTYSGVQCRPGFYLVEGAGNGDANGTRGCAQHVTDILGPTSLAAFSAALTMESAEAQDVSPGTERSWVVPVSGATAGAITDANPPPPQDSMLVQWLTAEKGGKGLVARRSRTYLPGIYATGQISGFLTPTLVDALSAWASLLFDQYVSDASDYQMHAVAFTPGSNPRTVQEIRPIADFSIDNVVAIQRSRRQGTGI